MCFHVGGDQPTPTLWGTCVLFWGCGAERMRGARAMWPVRGGGLWVFGGVWRRACGGAPTPPRERALWVPGLWGGAKGGRAGGVLAAAAGWGGRETIGRGTGWEEAAGCGVRGRPHSQVLSIVLLYGVVVWCLFSFLLCAVLVFRFLFFPPAWCGASVGAVMVTLFLPSAIFLLSLLHRPQCATRAT